MTDGEISQATIDAAVAGQANALNAIVSTLQKRVFRLARRMMLDPSDAEDATQEALLRVVTHLLQFRSEAKFSTWVWRIAVNTFKQFRGQRYRAPMLSLAEFAHDLGEGLQLEAAERTDDAVLLEQLKEGCGAALLATLDADHRLAYVLGEIMELSGEEAAEVLEVEPAAYRKRLSRARERVRDALKRHCGIVEASNPCRCHRRLAKAQSLGRCGLGLGVPRVDMAALRAEIARIDGLERAAAFYRADPQPIPRRDLVAAVRGLLRTVG